MAKKKQAEEKEKDTRPTPFTTIGHISATRPIEFRDLQAMGCPYDAFLVNRAFSLTEDTVLMASMMNERSWLPQDMQATFYIHAVRPRKRFEKWPKSLVDTDLNIVARYYGMSKREARGAHGLHTKEQLKTMKAMLDEGATPTRA